jgi:hypothetical protein
MDFDGEYNKKENIMRLSNQALGALMLALQKSLLEQSDITETLKGFHFQLDENEELIILNPPTVRMNYEIFDNMQETKTTIGSD